MTRNPFPLLVGTACCVFMRTINDSGEAQSMKNANIRKTQNWGTCKIESLNNKKNLFQKIFF
jgi:hypothetical protein